MYKFTKLYFLNIIFSLILFLIGFISSEEYNLFYFGSLILLGLVIESYFRFLYLRNKNIKIIYEGGEHTTIKTINEYIYLRFKVKKEDFKNKTPFIFNFSKNDIETTIKWEQDLLVLGIKVKSPLVFTIDQICFAEKDLLCLDDFIYYFVQSKKKILFLPNSIRNEYLELQIKKSIKNCSGKDYIKSIKEYEIGDNFKDINWKQSIKNDKFLINRYHNQEIPEITLYIDNVTGWSYKDEKSYEYLKENIIYLLNHSIYKNNIKTIIINNKNFDIKTQKEIFLEEMINLKAEQKMFNKDFLPIEESILVLTTRKLTIKNKIIIRK